MPHPIVEIDELLRLIIDELVEICPQTTVSLALTCRSLEEPTLSTLWKQQHSLPCLAEVLQSHTWTKNKDDLATTVSGHNFPADLIELTRPGDCARSFGRGLGQVATICFLDARIIPLF